MDTTRCVTPGVAGMWLVLLLGAGLFTVDGLPTKVQTHRPQSESLSDIVRDLENAVFRLKDYALMVDYANRKSSLPSDNDFEDPHAIVDSEFDIRTLDRQDTYPEVVAEANKKSVDDPKLPSASDKSASSAVAPQSQLKPAGANPAASINERNEGQQKTSTDDISLQEALEFLVNLAKQKKEEKRDHDIPFPLTDH